MATSEEDEAERDAAPGRLHVIGWAAGAVALVFVALYFWHVAIFALDVPVEDDVELLRFLVTRAEGGDASWFAFHNEHRPAVARLIFAIGTAVQGHADFAALAVASNLALLGVAALLCSWLPRGPWPARVAAGAPVVVLLFTLQHWQAATWATGAAQHYPTLLFAFGSIALLAQPTPARTAGAGALATAALLDLGAGLFAFVTGLGLLVRARAWREASVFAAWAALCTGLYFQGYDRPEHHPSVFAALAEPARAFDYACSLAGAGLSFDDVRVGWLARFAGLALGLDYVMALRDRRWRAMPRVFAAQTFLLLTLASVTATRFGFGLDQAFDSRYRVYSHAWMALVWIAFVRRRVDADRQTSGPATGDPGEADAHDRWRTLAGPAALALACAALLSFASIPQARARMSEHRDFYAKNMREWAQGTTMIPGPAGYSRVVERALDAGVYAFPCDDVGVEPADRNRWCEPAR